MWMWMCTWMTSRLGRSVVAAALLGACAGDGSPAGGARGDGGPADDGGGGGAGGGSGTRITLTNVTPARGNTLAWVGWNEGDGPWKTLEPAGGGYAFSVGGARFGVAFVCDRPDGVSGEVVQATVAELRALDIDCGRNPSSTTHALGGKIAGLDGAAGAQVSVLAGARWGTVVAMDGAASATYASQVPDDTYDVAAFAQIAGRTTRAVLRRGVAISADTVLDLDFAAGGLALVEQPLAVHGAPAAPAAGQQLTVDVSLRTGRGAVVGWNDTTMGQPADRYAAFAAADLGPEDQQEVLVVSFEQGAGTFDLRGVVRGVRAPRPLEVTLPPAFSSARVTAAAGGSGLRPRMTFEPYEGAVLYQMDAHDAGQTRPVGWLAIVSAAWLAGATSYELPDFSGARGFDDAFQFRPQAVLEVEPYAVRSSRDFARTINNDLATHDGSEVQYARTLRSLSGR
jgi:hypothetical protein